MSAKSIQQQIELFHLLFLRHLGDCIDKEHYTLKGGCNLRFYFKSIRYSEDIDLDVKTVAKDTLKTQVTKLLEASTFERVLGTRKLEILNVTTPKQTETTQRWKISLRVHGTTTPVPTKIEFSRRGTTSDGQLKAIDSEIIAAYELYPILLRHYELEQAFLQKVAALAGRTETQARDIFDLDLLINKGVKTKILQQVGSVQLKTATENALNISYADYKSQVVAYLSKEYRQAYENVDSWNVMQERIVEFLHGAY
jgi:predicted nucleotidyltransferase component of viral defense system